MGRKSRLKQIRKIELAKQIAWTTFEQCNVLFGPDGEPRPIPDGYRIFRNSRYQVWMRAVEGAPGWPNVCWLSIKRNDKEPIHDWRDLQRIKNELCGPDLEAVELYPAEDRLVDGANQYHLWVMLDKNFRFPFGYTERLVSDGSIYGEKQRPFELRPPDLVQDLVNVEKIT